MADGGGSDGGGSDGGWSRGVVGHTFIGGVSGHQHGRQRTGKWFRIAPGGLGQTVPRLVVTETSKGGYVGARHWVTPVGGHLGYVEWEIIRCAPDWR